MTAVAGGFLDKARTIAPPGYNRWLVPPCALAIHLCIGMAYGFSVFWLPLGLAIGITDPVTCHDLTLARAITTTSCDWRVSDLVWTYSIFFVVLGLAAALWGGWLERVGPRKAGVVAACCWCGGMAIGAVGVAIHQLWLLWLGTGLIGGIGLGIGYISPVSTLIKWFPDRRGMATGMAIMGFGGGAMIGSPLADRLMRHFADGAQVGVWQTMLVLAAIYLVFMMSGALGYRLPPDGWSPAGHAAPNPAASGFHVHLRHAHKTPQFWLIWSVLLLNVSASIGIIGVASPMLQEVFGGRLIDQAGKAFTAFGEADKLAAAAIGAGFVGIISLFNIVGRFVWASSSDRIGRKATYAAMTALGALLYGFAAPALAGGPIAVFIIAFCIIASMYGGGFATVPAYLADIFGTRYVGAIHGRILTAWSTAGIVGPFVVTAMRENRIAAGVPRDQVYQPIYLAHAAMLALAFVLNLLIKPVHARHHAASDNADMASLASCDGPSPKTVEQVLDIKVLLAWAAVGVPILWGVYETLGKAAILLK